MRTGAMIIQILLSLLFVGAQAAIAAPAYMVAKGHEHFIRLDRPIIRLSVGDGTIADVSLIDDKTVRLLGLALGNTTFSIWHNEAALPSVHEVTVTPPIEALNRQFQSSKDLAPSHLFVEGGKVILSGRFADSNSRDQARQMAAYLTGSEILDMTELATDESIQIDVQFATMARSTLDALGFNFSYLGKEFAFASTAPNTLKDYSFNADIKNKQLVLDTASPIAKAFNLLIGSPRENALSVISALKSNNLARSLAEPSVVVQSGGEADFIVGGEIPIPVPQGGTSNATTIEYKRFGVNLHVTPTLVKNRRIAMRIKPEVSELDFSNAILLEGFTIPAIRTRGTETVVEVAENETLILAGMTFANSSELKEKLPYVGDIPLLGELFRRSQEQTEENELIVLVTPRLVTATSQNTERKDRLLSATEQETHLKGARNNHE